jgi:hypothetical protein
MEPSLRLGGGRQITTESSDKRLRPDTRQVRIAEGNMTVPRSFVADFAREGWKVGVKLRIRMIQGQPEIEWMTVEGRVRPDVDERSALGPHYPVTPADLRQVAKVLDQEIFEIVAFAASPIYYDAEGLPYTFDDETLKARRSLEAKAARRKLTPELLLEVAKVYRQSPTLPRARVASFYGIPEATASRWIKAARREGYLGAAPKPGVSGEVTSRKAKP